MHSLTVSRFHLQLDLAASAHGGGGSLEVINPITGLDLNNPLNWRSSTVVNGTPGSESSIALNAPSGLTITQATTTQLTLQWTDNESTEQGYLVFRRLVGATAFSQIASLPANATNYIDNNNGTGLAPGQSYEYRIQAFSSSGFSKLAGIAAQTITGIATNLAASSANGGSQSCGPPRWELPDTTSIAAPPPARNRQPRSLPAYCRLYTSIPPRQPENRSFMSSPRSIPQASEARSGEVSVASPLGGAIIGTAGSFNNSGNTIAKVFDGNVNTFFDGPDASGDWVGLDFGIHHAANITKFSYAPPAATPPEWSAASSRRKPRRLQRCRNALHFHQCTQHRRRDRSTAASLESRVPFCPLSWTQRWLQQYLRAPGVRNDGRLPRIGQRDIG